MNNQSSSEDIGLFCVNQSNLSLLNVPHLRLVILTVLDICKRKINSVKDTTKEKIICDQLNFLANLGGMVIRRVEFFYFFFSSGDIGL